MFLLKSIAYGFMNEKIFCVTTFMSEKNLCRHIVNTTYPPWKYSRKKKWFTVSVFRRQSDEICPLLGYYAASSGNCLTKFRDNLSVPSSRAKKSKYAAPSGNPLSAFQDNISVLYSRVILEYRTDRLSRNAGKGLQLDAV